MKIYLWADIQDEIWRIDPSQEKYSKENWFTPEDIEIVRFIKKYGTVVNVPVSGTVWELELPD